MRSDEFLVERYLLLEKNLKAAKEKCEDLQDDIDTAQEELADFENLVHILSKHIKVNKFGVVFELKSYVEDDKADIDYLANYFDVEVKEDEQGEN